jgi:hypothetical protein
MGGTSGTGWRGLAAMLAIAVTAGAALPALGDAAARIAKGAIGTAELRDGAVTNAKVRRGSLRLTAFARGQVAPADLRGIRAGGALAGTFPRPGLARGAVDAAAIAPNAVGRSELAAGAVGPDELAPGAVRAADIADGAIGQAKLAAGSVGAAQIRAGAVGASELAPLPGGRAVRLARYDVASGMRTAIPFTEADYSRGGAWDPSRPARLTAPVDGVYLVSGFAVFAANAAGSRGLWLAPAGDPDAPWAGDVRDARRESGQATPLSVTTVVHLEAGDGVALVAWQDAGTPVAVGGPDGGTGLALQLLSP